MNYPIPFRPQLSPRLGDGEAGHAYLAGPMRGYPLQNFPAFMEAALILRRAGWLVENPAEYDMAAGVDPSAPQSEWPLTIGDMLRTDFRLILEECNAIVLLPGWSKSVGAKMELAIAYHIGLPAFELATGRDGLLELVRLHIERPPTVTFDLATVTFDLAGEGEDV